MESLSFQYPAWYILLCVLLGLSYAGLLYYRDKTFREQSSTLNWLLGIIRFITVSLLAILLLSPLLKSLQTETKKPIVILAQDQSESIAAEMNGEALQEYQQKYKALSDDLKKNFEVKELAFGDEVREGVDFVFEDKVSNISSLLSTVNDLYSSENLGAVVLATDGIYNKGSNPVYTGTKLTAPIYTVALGDTTPKRDLVLKRVFHNRIAYLGDKFSIQTDITAQNCSGSATSISVSKVGPNGSERLVQNPLQIDSDDFFATQEFVLDADQVGVQRYRVTVSQIEGEVTTVNNSKDIFVDVLDARQKILIVANSPHPDVTALRQSITRNKNYEVKVDYINNPKENVASFDFVILHQLPSFRYDASNVINVLNNKNIPRWFIVGTQTNLGRFNQVQDLVTIQSDSRNTNEVQGRIAPGFNSFTIAEALEDALPNFAPLQAPFGDFVASEDAEVLLYQRIGRIDTRYPLLLLGEQRNTRVGVLCAEGIWKWRLFDFLQNQNHDLFEELFGKTVQFVSLKEDKRKFRVNTPRNIFNENESIDFDAELYNDSYELINGPDASITITNSEGKDFNFTFNKTARAYALNAGIFPVGNYTFRASVFSNGEDLAYTGQFSVQPIQLEVYETTANHGLLRLLSEKYGGDLIYPEQLEGVAGLIRDSGKAKPIIYQNSQTRSVINLKWIFFILLILLTTEWFLRRYFGGY